MSTLVGLRFRKNTNGKIFIIVPFSDMGSFLFKFKSLRSRTRALQKILKT